MRIKYYEKNYIILTLFITVLLISGYTYHLYKINHCFGYISWEAIVNNELEFNTFIDENNKCNQMYAKYAFNSDMPVLQQGLLITLEKQWDTISQKQKEFYIKVLKNNLQSEEDIYVRELIGEILAK